MKAHLFTFVKIYWPIFIGGFAGYLVSRFYERHLPISLGMLAGGLFSAAIALCANAYETRKHRQFLNEIHEIGTELRAKVEFDRHHGEPPPWNERVH